MSLDADHIFSYFIAAEVTPTVLGALPEGFRVTIVNDELEVRGARLNGRVLPGGGDWMTVRADGAALLDVRNIIETDDGARILYLYTGVGDFGADGYRRMLEGDPPSGAPRFSSADPRYAWLNRRQGIVLGNIAPGAVTEMRVFALA